MKKSIIIIVPSLKATSPVKGAFALANLLQEFNEVTILPLNSCSPSEELFLNKKKEIKVIYKLKFKKKDLIFNFLRLQSFFNTYFNTSNSYKIISFCLIPDIYNGLLRFKAEKISSIRANNIGNYFYSLGLIGVPLAIFHYLILNLMNSVVVMHQKMADQVSNYLINKRKIVIIPNFSDFRSIDYEIIYPSKEPFKIIYVGLINERKDPFSLLKPIKILKDKGYNITLEYFGEGELKEQLIEEIFSLELSNEVFVKGFSNEIYNHLMNSHLFVLPSFSEGLSRACLEALEYGIPCLIREIYGNSDVIKPSLNGYLFKNNNDLVDKIEYFFLNFNYKQKRRNLLPSKYHRENIIRCYKKLIN